MNNPIKMQDRTIRYYAFDIEVIIMKQKIKKPN